LKRAAIGRIVKLAPKKTARLARMKDPRLHDTGGEKIDI
jgi:hypothetical protein